MAKVTIERIQRAREKRDQAYNQLKDLVVKSVGDGVLLRDAAEAAGVTYETMRLWRLEAGDIVDARKKGTPTAETKKNLASARRVADSLRATGLAQATQKAPAKKKTAAAPAPEAAAPAPAEVPATETPAPAPAKAGGKRKASPKKKVTKKKVAPAPKRKVNYKVIETQPTSDTSNGNGHSRTEPVLTTAQRRRIEAAAEARSKKLAAAKR